MTRTTISKSKTPLIGWASLGCAKALVDSQRLIARLKSRGYGFAESYETADLVVVNTCGFIESAEEESLEAIEEALQENGKVIAVGCLGERPERILKAHPKVARVLGSSSDEAILEAVESLLPSPLEEPLAPDLALRLTPKHYAYLKIAEGCNHHCTFCIIPTLRGPLVSRSIDSLLKEAQALAEDGVKELILIAQDTFAYGSDWKSKTALFELLDALEPLGLWVRLQYLYPYPQLESLLPRMQRGTLLPYLDVPLQHVSPGILKAMQRIRYQDQGVLLSRLKAWREAVPELSIRSSFIVGFPGESERDFEALCEFVLEAKLNRIGVFTYSEIEGAKANAFPNAVDPELREERKELLMNLQSSVSEERLKEKIGRQLEVILDELEEGGKALGRTKGDSPEVDGLVRVSDLPLNAREGSIVRVKIQGVEGAHDLFGSAR